MVLCPRVSVIIPTYNCEKYIVQTIESVLKQTYSNFEIIVIDDGSTDNTKKIIEKFINSHKIRYIYQTNSGQSAARNKGIEESNGEYIAFLDADDYWKKEKLKKQIEVLKNKNIGICYTNVEFIDDKTEEIIPVFRNRKHKKMRRGIIYKYLIFYNFIPFAGIMVRKECLEKIGGFDKNIKMGDDWDILLRLSVHYEFDYINEKLLKYRTGRKNQLSTNLEIRFEEQDKIIDKFFYQNRELLDTSLIKKTKAFRSRERGAEYSTINFKRALNYYCEACKIEPLNIINYKGILKLILKKIM